MKRSLVVLAATLLAVSCAGERAPATPFPLTPVQGDQARLRDGQGRYVFLNGINTSGGNKLPATLDANGVPSYVGKPFPLDQADRHFGILQEMGFNSIRLLVMWEGLQPTGPDTVDGAYVAYLREIVKAAGRHGIRVLLEMHQDDFSRHLFARYNQHPTVGVPGSLENTLSALLGPYDDVVSGNGAPRWVVEACLPERDLSSPGWGIPRAITGLKTGDVDAFVKAYRLLTNDTGALSEEFVAYFRAHLPGPYPVSGTSDFLPLSSWGVSAALSLDIARCYGAFFAGKGLFPNLAKNGKNVQDYLQDAYLLAWTTLARAVEDLPNVLGYDVFNEPNANVLVLAAVAAAVKAGAIDGAKGLLQGALGKDPGDRLYDILVGFRILPPDTTAQTLHDWGLDTLDVVAAVSANVGFDRNWLQPFYAKVGTAIQLVDPDAVIFIEPSISAATFLGGALGGVAGGMWDVSMTAPDVPHPDRVVWAPHWYPDMYPFLSFVRTPRTFSVDEIRYRDYAPSIAGMMAQAQKSLGNLPAVFAEFGMFFDFGGIEAARAQDYAVTAAFLNNYFEALERLNVSRMMWDYCPENSWTWGDLWNHEDLSIVDPDGKWRADKAWQRPHPQALAGKPISMHYWSELHEFDPEKATPDPVGEFELRYASRETDAPTEIFIPTRQYPDGFYVWVSDGLCDYDPAQQVLYHFPRDDDPDAEYTITVRRPLPGAAAVGWRYFFHGDQSIAR